MNTVIDEAFALPPPLVEVKEEKTEEVSRSRGASGDSEDLLAYDADEHDLGSDPAMVRSPYGTHWVSASQDVKLEYPYGIWFSHRPRKQATEYEDGLQFIGSVATVQEFWRYWNAMDLLRLEKFASLSVFKQPIKPMWEDEGNKNGGRWVLNVADHAAAAGLYTKLALALIAGYFECSSSLCGVTFSVKPTGSQLALWHASASSEILTPATLELQELLGLEDGNAASKGITVEYKPHAAEGKETTSGPSSACSTAAARSMPGRLIVLAAASPLQGHLRSPLQTTLHTSLTLPTAQYSYPHVQYGR